MAAIARASDEVEPGAEHEGPDDDSTPDAAPALDGPGSRLVGPALAAVLCLALAAVIVLTVMVRGERATDDTSEDAVKEVGTALTRLLSWKSQSVEAELDHELKLLHGDFADEYETLVREIIAPAARKSKLDATAEVVASGVVETKGDDEIVLLYFVNVEVEPSGGKPNQPLTQADPLGNATGSRIQVTAAKVDGKWLIEEYDPI